MSHQHPPAPGAIAQRDENSHFAVQLLVLAVIFAVCGLLAFWVDLLVSLSFLGDVGPIWEFFRDGIQKLVRPTEIFAHGITVFVLLWALHASGGVRRRQWIGMLIIVYSAGILANVGKILIARTRPRHLFDLEANTFAGNVVDSFSGWFPLASLGYPGQSFPSGHTTIVVALAIVLSHCWPKARHVFITLSVLAALQRIAFGHHYLSDCFGGAALACTVGFVSYHPALAGQWLNRLTKNVSSASEPAGLSIAQPNSIEQKAA